VGGKKTLEELVTWGGGVEWALPYENLGGNEKKNGEKGKCVGGRYPGSVIVKKRKDRDFGRKKGGFGKKGEGA